MSGDRPTLPEDQRPLSGTAAGTSYLALPPTAVDARPAGPTRLILAWPGFDPPRTASALAAALPMTGVPTWRVYLELSDDPASGAGAPDGLDSGALLESEHVEAYCTAVERAVERLPATLDEIRRDLDIEDDGGPVGLAGFSFGATVALLALARDTVPVSTAALVTPVLSPARAAASLERRTGRDRDWTDAATALAERLDVTAQVSEIAARDAAILLIAGVGDRVVPPAEITDLHDRLREHGAFAVESATFRMAHALVPEPGTTAQAPTTEAVRVDGVLNDWFRERLAKLTASEPPHAGSTRGSTEVPASASTPAVVSTVARETAPEAAASENTPEHSPAADLEAEAEAAPRASAPDETRPHHTDPPSGGGGGTSPVPQPTSRPEDPNETRPEAVTSSTAPEPVPADGEADTEVTIPSPRTPVPPPTPANRHPRTPMGEPPASASTAAMPTPAPWEPGTQLGINQVASR